MWPILKIDARTQIEAAPDEQTEMRCRSANQSLITDVLALRPYFCTIQLQPVRTAMQCGAKLLRPQPLTGDIRSYDHPTNSASFQRLDAHEDAVMVDIPDGDRRGRIVDPGAPIMR